MKKLLILLTAVIVMASCKKEENPIIRDGINRSVTYEIEGVNSELVFNYHSLKKSEVIKFRGGKIIQDVVTSGDRLYLRLDLAPGTLGSVKVLYKGKIIAEDKIIKENARDGSYFVIVNRILNPDDFK